jgi:hypothetical protein
MVVATFIFAPLAHAQQGVTTDPSALEAYAAQARQLAAETNKAKGQAASDNVRYGYAADGRVTLCDDQDRDRVSPGWEARCRAQEAGKPTPPEILRYQLGYGGGSPGLLGLVD